MSDILAKALNEKAQLVAGFFEAHFSEANIKRRIEQLIDSEINSKDLSCGVAEILSSMRYSCLQDGKRFRPALSMMVAEALGATGSYILPYAAAVECIHTYSLIHDDLPMMDDDDIRRGKPTNHKVYGEAIALLAGDALQGEAFYLIGEHYQETPLKALQASSRLAAAVGLYGMVGGQGIDIKAQEQSQGNGQLTLSRLELMHRLKTGALIQVSATGAGLLCGATTEQLAQLVSYARGVGLAFQIADDLLDYDPENIEPGSYPALIGLDASRQRLDDVTERSLEAIKSWSSQADPLRELAQFNKLRMH